MHMGNEEGILNGISIGYDEDFSFEHSLYDIFESHVNEKPDSIAVTYEDNKRKITSLTYRQLFIAIDMVAEKLKDMSSDKPATVGVYGERSIYTLVSLLAVLKSGNIYVPLDITYPAAHVTHIIEDASLSLILTTDEFISGLPEGKVQILTLDFIDLSQMPDVTQYKEMSLNQSNLNNPALIMYTSGTTGKPKGVKHRQHQLINRFNWVWKNYPFNESDCTCQRTNVNFMPSMWEFLGGLLQGVRMVILADTIVKDPGKLIDALERHDVTCFLVVPSLMQRMLESVEDLEKLSKVRFWITAGEPLSPELFNKFIEKFPQSVLLNDYGATEVNGVLHFDSRSEILPGMKLPGFKPIANVRAYILDENLSLCPSGVTGELHIAGIPLALEYMNLPDENKRKFLDNPFNGDGYDRLFKMGDTARYLPDGTIEILGRADQQVKIRGIRIELSSIEKVLSENGSIWENAVFAKEVRSGVKRLIGCIVVREDFLITEDELKAFVGERLPEYMIPSKFLFLKELPHTPNGKIDRHKLMNTNISDLKKEFGKKKKDTAAENIHETSEPELNLSGLIEQFREIAATVLGIDKEEVEASKKFYAVGFDSMTIVDFLNKINLLYGIKLEISDLYDYSRIDELCEYLLHNKKIVKTGLDNSVVLGDGINQSNVQTKGINEVKSTEESDTGDKVQDYVQDKAESMPERKADITRENLGVSFEDTSGLTEQLRDFAASVLGIDKSEVEPKKKFYAVGFDSMTIVDFLNKINSIYAIKLEVSDLYDYATIDELAVFLSKKGVNVDAPLPANNDGEKKLPERDVHIEKMESQPWPVSNSVSGTGNNSTKVAIVGVSGRFPGADDIYKYWDNLAGGVDSVTEVPKNRWDMDSYYDTDQKKPFKSISKWGGLLEQVDLFDPEFFNILPRECEFMDPQQRLCMEECWKALEDAGYRDKDLDNMPVGVFIGARPGDYTNLIYKNNISPDAYTTMGCDFAILAARVAYYLNLKGPCLSVDTACSSSLVAIHLAYSSILTGGCDMAVAGGVNVMSSPDLILKSSKMGMLSPDGRCKTFDNDANGIVLGEGVGIVILKRLDKALADKDRIYGVIAGSAINQDGKTNGITAPSAAAQYELIKSVYEKNDISPENINYVECHGTGTKLGDPIEIKALSQAFREWTQKKQFCDIGSVKTNIGHTVGCSGVAGLIKILLSMKYGKIPATLHYKNTNQHIDFKESPFTVNTVLKDWSHPRVAALSSFGFSGTNSHMVIEEAPVMDINENSKLPYYLILLSAKTKQALLRKASDLKSWLSEKGEEHSLHDIAYTLQKRRSHFAFRLAMVVENLSDLAEKLSAYQNGVDNPLVFIKCDNHRDGLKNIQIPDISDYILSNRVTCLEALKELANIYIEGGDAEWDILGRNGYCYPISIPAYPFEREKYWVPVNEANVMETVFANTKKPHPLLDENLSTLREQKFRTVFKSSDDLIKEHVINNSPVLPGAVQLEMALAAGRISSENDIGAFHSVVWKRPVVFDRESKEVYVRLLPHENEIHFVIEAVEANGPVEVCEGFMELKGSSVEVAPSMDISEIKRRNRANRNRDSLYNNYLSCGIRYGNAYQTVREVYYNDRELLSYLELGSASETLKSNCILIPQILDGALHSIAGFDEVFNLKGTYMPFLLENMEIYGNMESECYAYMKLEHGMAGEASNIIKGDIDILSREGRLLVKMTGFTVKQVQSDKISTGEKLATMFITERWKEEDIFSQGRNEIPVGDLIVFANQLEHLPVEISKNSRVVQVREGNEFRRISSNLFEVGSSVEDYAQLVDGLAASGSKSLNFMHLWALDNYDGSDKIAACLDRSGNSLFGLAKALIKVIGAGIQVNLVYAYSGELQTSYPLYAGIGGFIKTVMLEKPEFNFKSIEVKLSGSVDRQKLLLDLYKELSSPSEIREIRYENGGRRIKLLEKLDLPQESLVSYRGLFVITGGLGGIGYLFARYLLEKPECSVVLIGRSALNGHRQELLDSLKSISRNVKYIVADVSDYNQIERALNESRSSFGPISGILHCAGMIKDSFLLKKEKFEFDQVLEPKIKGTLYLDELTKDDHLEFFSLFSSITSVFGNVGQCDYAYANRFMDKFSTLRERMRLEGKRSGKTISVNWPLWKKGGMSISQEMLERMKRDNGMTALDNEDGIKAFEMALKLQLPSVAVVAGDEILLDEMLQRENGISKARQDYQDVCDFDTLDEEWLLKKTSEYLTGLLSGETGLSSDRFKPEKQFDEYGMNSLMIMNMTDELEKNFGRLSKTLFFEYRNIDELKNYFVKNHSDKLKALFGYEPVKKEKAPVQEKKTSESIGRLSVKAIKYTAPADENRIAIIGLSGRYPMADSLSDFWNNLTSGMDCITEVPEGRWDYKKYFHPDKNMRGKVYSKWGGFIKDFDKFDPLFFNISPKEAELMDPQERLFLETAWETLEDAGYTRKRLSDYKVGVYVGVMWGQYQLYGASDALLEKPISNYASVANRVSYVLNLNGPSMAVDTMCSSSFSAIKIACDSLLKGDIEYAVAGGVNVTSHPNKYFMISQGKFGSTDGRCKSFGEGGDGYVPGEGVGAVLLKPFKQAVKDGDHIYGVIIGSALNHGGKTNGYTVPSPVAQARLISEGIRNANITPRSISYIEAHGTGTALGDPIEIDGITKAFSEFTPEKQFCPIGSIKSNIGHLESAAGIAALTKVLLQMKNNMLVPSIHSQNLNSRINFEDSPVYVQRGLSRWEKPSVDNNGVRVSYPLRAGISSFGAGGSNAFLLVEKYENKPIKPVMEEKGVKRIIVLSARSEDRLKAYAAKVRNFLKNSGINHVYSQDVTDRNGMVSEEDLKDMLCLTACISKEMLHKDEAIGCYFANTNELLQFVVLINKKYQIPMGYYNVSPDMTVGELFDIIAGFSLKKNPYMNQKMVHETKMAYENDQKPLSLSDLAYTLQIGREAMDERLAIIAASVEELAEKLECYLKGIDTDGLFKGRNGEKTDFLDFFESDTEMDVLLKKWYSEGKFERIAMLWTGGLEIDWQRLYDTIGCTVIPLPTYPFNRERYWISTEGLEEGTGRIKVLHTMIDRNVSTLYEQCYTKLIRSDDILVRDHVVAGQMIVPGTALVEMARAAGELCKNHEEVCRVLDIRWLSPLIIEGDSQEVGVSLYPKNENVEFEIFTGHEERVIHASGLLSYDGVDAEKQRVDLQGLKSRCCKKIDGEFCYALFKERGLHYGQNFMSISEIYFNENEALAYLELPDGVKEFDDMKLHPVLLDGVLQSVLGLEAGDSRKSTRLPFSIEEITMHRPLNDDCLVYVRKNSFKYDMTVLGMQGEAVVEIKGFFLKDAVIVESSEAESELLYFIDNWMEKDFTDGIVNGQEKVLVFDEDDARFSKLKELCPEVPVIRVKNGKSFIRSGFGFEIDMGNAQDYQRLFTALEEEGLAPSHILYCWTDSKDSVRASISSNSRELAKSLLSFSKALIGVFRHHEVKVRMAFFGNWQEMFGAAANAFFKSVSPENSKNEYKTIAFTEMEADITSICKSLKHELFTAGKAVEEISYIEGKRLVRGMEEISLPEKDGQKPCLFTPGGVYLITGGAGGLGMIFANHLAQMGRCTIVLAGRSELSDEKKAALGCIKGADIRYIRADITDRAAAERLYQEIKNDYGKLNAIIHSVGVLRDSLIMSKTADDFENVLAPKMDGFVYLDEIIGGEKLDYFIVFSSIASVIGNIGQVDYAFANRLLDVYAEQRNQRVLKGERYGATFAINWPLWKEGGMQMSAEAVAMLYENAGLKPLNAESGVRAFNDIMQLGLPRLIPVEGSAEKLREWLLGCNKAEVKAQMDDVKDVDVQGYGLLDRTFEYVKNIISETTKVPVSKIRNNDTFDKYGVDSVMLLTMGRELGKHFGSKAQSAFIEYPSVRDLSGYLVKHYQEQLSRLLGVERDMPEAKVTAPADVVKSSSSKEFLKRLGNRTAEANASVHVTARENVKDIAVIGMSGRYPGAKDLNEFWNNLTEGKNCITEIPSDRWDASQFYSTDKEDESKACSKWGGFIDHVDKFDPLFFNISPREAALMDPQERIFLETVWHALEDAGYSKEMLNQYGDKGQHVGVFVGSMYQQYPWLARDTELGAVLSGNSYWSIANRVSYFLGLNGPSIALDTACSSSLMAMHLAMESIRRGECSMAIVGGVNLSLHPYKYLGLSRAHLLGSKDKSMSLGDGDGYVPGEGVGVVVIKGLEEAKKDNDRIYCIAKACVTNHSGKSSAYKVPSEEAQQALIIRAFNEAGIEPGTLGYFETASNGSALGDAVEIEAIKGAFEKLGTPSVNCAIGTVKSNIGHLEAASGMSQMAKVILQLRNRMLVPSINAEVPNPNINFSGTGLFVQKELAEWKPAMEVPLRAAVNSVGAGGTNVTLILEEYLPEGKSESRASGIGPAIVPLSARNEERLELVAGNIKDYLEKNLDISLDDLSYTLFRREPMEERLAIIAENREELINLLEKYLSSGETSEKIIRGSCDEIHNSGNALANRPFATENYDLARSWVDGQNSIKDKCLKADRYTLLKLPVYPFESERYWLDASREHKEERIIVDKVQERVLNELRNILSELLQIPAEKIKEEWLFDKYGMDSLTASKMLNILRDRYGKRISIQSLFDNYTLSKFAEVVTNTEASATDEEGLLNQEDRTVGYINDLPDGFKYYLDNMLLSCIEEGKVNPDEALALKERILLFVEGGNRNDRERNLS